jgi:hypothetical protein
VINPMTAVAAMSRELLTLQRNKTARPSAAISAVSQSPSDLAGRHARTDDRADRRGIGPLTKPCTFGLARWRKRIEVTATIRKSDGKKISIVDTSDPQKPATRKPTKVAVIRTGPWLSMTTATATRNSRPFTGAPARSEIGVLPPRNRELYRGCREYWPL